MLVEVLVADLVSRLVLAVVGRVFLHSIVGQVDQPVVPLIDAELAT